MLFCKSLPADSPLGGAEESRGQAGANESTMILKCKKIILKFGKNWDRVFDWTSLLFYTVA